MLITVGLIGVFLCVQLKQMEVQLEEEYDEKQKVLKERREMESKLLSAQDKVTAPLCTVGQFPVLLNWISERLC